MSTRIGKHVAGYLAHLIVLTLVLLAAGFLSQFMSVNAAAIVTVVLWVVLEALLAVRKKSISS